MNAIIKPMDFAEELNRVLPDDVPNRETVVRKSAEHLELIAEMNQHLNLTRITSPRDAAIKHVADSVFPWRLFAGATHILDAGTGAGFPGIPLAVVLPDVRFTLAESTQKKARFVESALSKLALPNVSISATRAEELARNGAIDLIAARALAPVAKVLNLLGHALQSGVQILLYKGPEVSGEIALAEKDLKKLRVQAQVVMRYELPDSLGTRTIVELRRY